MTAKNSNQPHLLQIKAMRLILHDGEFYQPGDLFEVDSNTALILISIGSAQKISHA